jgi:predicted metalloprotease
MTARDSVALLRLQARLIYLEEEIDALRARSQGRFRQATARKLAEEELRLKLIQVETLKKEIEHLMSTAEPGSTGH